jgi:hypothetical protein
VAGHTDITGALIASIDESGKDTGQLTLNTGSLSFTDLRNTHQSSDSTVALNTNVLLNEDKSPEKGTTKAPQDSKGEDQPTGTTNLGIHQNSSQRAGKTLATIGNGSITVGGETTTPEGLNRDIEEIDKELYSIDRVKGDLDLTVENKTLVEVADKVGEGAEAMTDALGLTGMSEEERLALAETISAEFFGGLDAVKAKNEAQKAEQQKMVADEVDKILLSLGLPTEEVPGEALPGEMTFYVAEVRAALIASQADGLDPVAAALAMAKLKLDVESIPGKDISNPEVKDKALYQIDLVMQSYLEKYETAEALGGVGLPLTVRRLVIAGAKDVMEHGAEAAAPFYEKLKDLTGSKSNPNSFLEDEGGLAAVADMEASGFSIYDKFKKSNGDWNWPEDDGFVKGTQQIETLPVGSNLDRYGDIFGGFFAPIGTSGSERALAPGSMSKDLNQYEVIRPLPIISGKVAPAFGQKGGGTQYKIINPKTGEPADVKWLLDNKYIAPRKK